VLQRTPETLVRLLRFHLGNGLVSLVGNVAPMAWLCGVLRRQYLIANVLSTGACALLNFAVSEWSVFRPESGVRKGKDDGANTEGLR
jgi:putative flippase GtrA